MCRWLAYSGSPILLEELLYNRSTRSSTRACTPGWAWRRRTATVSASAGTASRARSRVVQSTRDSRVPVIFRGTGPAWNDVNLRELARSTSSGHFIAHIRASTGTAVQQTNCHPFRHDRWLWVHNGAIKDFHLMKRDLVMAIDPELYPSIQGSTDSETMFYLALTFGLREDPVAAVERMVGFVEATGREHGVDKPMQMTVGTTDGERLFGFRYSSIGKSRTLYFSSAIATLRVMYPENEIFQKISDETRIVVSEPLGDLLGAWNPVPESSYGIVQKGEDSLGRFTPRLP